MGCCLGLGSALFYVYAFGYACEYACMYAFGYACMYACMYASALFYAYACKYAGVGGMRIGWGAALCLL